MQSRVDGTFGDILTITTEEELGFGSIINQMEIAVDDSSIYEFLSYLLILKHFMLICHLTLIIYM